MWHEFRAFAMRGNVVDLAVGIILGAAFTTIVNSLVNDLIMPPLGLLIGGIDLSNFFVTLKGGSYPTLEAAKTAGAVTINVASPTTDQWNLAAIEILASAPTTVAV